MPEVQIKPPIRVNALYERHRAEIDALLRKYPTRRSALLPILWIIQHEDGWISEAAMAEAAALCDCTPAEVLEVVSFYPMYHRAPVGKYLLGVCGTLPCALCGSDGLYDYLKDKLGISYGQTTDDGLFTLKRFECLGACSEAPVMLVNDRMEANLTRDKVNRILDECRRGDREPYFTGRRA